MNGEVQALRDDRRHRNEQRQVWPMRLGDVQTVPGSPSPRLPSKRPWVSSAFAVVLCVCARSLSFAVSSLRPVAGSSPRRLSVRDCGWLEFAWSSAFLSWFPHLLDPCHISCLPTLIPTRLGPMLGIKFANFEHTHILLINSEFLTKLRACLQLKGYMFLGTLVGWVQVTCFMI